jgi:hypothetical protein
LGGNDVRWWTYSPLRDQARFLKHHVQDALARGQTIYADIDGVAVPIRAVDFGCEFKPPKSLLMYERRR